MILSEARELLYDVVVPTIDSQENIDRFNRYLNLVQERFLNSGKWTGMFREVVIVSDSGFFTLPARFVSCLAAKSICGCPLGISNRWYAYRYPSIQFLADFGTNVSTNWSLYGYNNVNDMGDGFVSFRDSPYSSYTLRITRENAGDDGTKVLFKGYDEDGKSIFTPQVSGSTSYEGVTYELTGAQTNTTTVFTGPLMALRKLRTIGYIYLDAVNKADVSQVTRIGYYSPSEIAPSYHRYWIGCRSDEEPYSAAAICKLRFTPAVADSDEVVPSNANALRAGLAALKCDAEGDMTRRDAYFADGIKLLSDEARENRGGAKFSLRIDPAAFQFGRLWQGR
jgi:hypothetical protein